jgi:hypothetical protein
MREPPMMGDFINIFQEPYKLDVNDCSNKSKKYIEILRREGYHASILVVDDDRETFKVIDGVRYRLVHVIIRIRINKYETFYADVTHFDWSEKLIKLGDGNWRVLRKVTPLEELISEEYKIVSEEDLKKLKKEEKTSTD